jgi:hypothetical protein
MNQKLDPLNMLGNTLHQTFFPSLFLKAKRKEKVCRAAIEIKTQEWDSQK